jgi:predicted ATPase
MQNRVPDDLYHHGIQRDRMASFLDALKSRCDLVELDGGRDWRRGVDEDALPRMDGWFELGDEDFDRLWDAEGQGKSLVHPPPADVVSSRSISVYSRHLPIPRATPSACRFTFAELCEEALGPADYISIASTFSRIYIDEVPVLLLKQKNEARRLINLLDALCTSTAHRALTLTNPVASCTSAPPRQPRRSSFPMRSPSLPTSAVGIKTRFRPRRCPRRYTRLSGQTCRCIITRRSCRWGRRRNACAKQWKMARRVT